MDDDEEYVSVIMRDECGILSRRELQTDKNAQEKLRELVSKYQADKRRMN